MKITCITTVFNEGNLLAQSVRSVLEQSYQNFQYIIVDDGANEATKAALAAIDDDRLLVIHQPNSGLSTARNKALEHIAGDFVCFMDADDIRPVWAFQAIADVIDRDDPDLVFCRGSLRELNGQLLPFYDTSYFESLTDRLSSSAIDTQAEADAWAVHLTQMIEPQVANKVVRTDLIKKHHLRFPDNQFFEDIFFHTLAIAYAKRISILDTLCFTYFRRYQKPQITSASDDRRFDVLAVVKMTLEAFQRTPAFHDPIHRAAVVASSLKLVQWCEETISHHHRHQYQRLARAILTMADPRYLALSSMLTFEIDHLEHARSYLRSLNLPKALEAGLSTHAT